MIDPPVVYTLEGRIVSVSPSSSNNNNSSSGTNDPAAENKTKGKDEKSVFSFLFSKNSKSSSTSGK
jgi:hypothetical protein